MLITSGKREAIVDPPWMNTAGALGFSDEAASSLDMRRLGAFITHPISNAPRRATSETRVHDFPGGFLLHTGLPNPGLTAVIREHGLRWRRMPMPVIVHIIADEPVELRQMLLQLEAVDAVSAVEVGLNVEDPVQIERQLGPVANSELPVIVRLSLDSGWAAIDAVRKAAPAAISLVPPRGAIVGPEGTSSGRVFGPSLFPLVLEHIATLAASLDIPVVVSGGIREPSEISALLSSGANAVQLDFALWTHPSVLQVETSSEP